MTEPFEVSLFLACALTVLIETPYLAFFGYRDRYALTVVVCVNVITNLTLNLALRFLVPLTGLSVLIGELAVVGAEYLLYRIAFGRRRGLFLLTLSANILSFGRGAAGQILRRLL